MKLASIFFAASAKYLLGAAIKVLQASEKYPDTLPVRHQGKNVQKV